MGSIGIPPSCGIIEKNTGISLSGLVRQEGGEGYEADFRDRASLSAAADAGGL